MEEPKLVSICVPVYGVEKYIERCARSLFEQTYHNIEYVFVNDCTPDHSIDVLNQVLYDYPERSSSIKVIEHSKNRGLAAARNTGIEHASGDFILWVDSDDSIDVCTVQKLMEVQSIEDADIVCYNIKAFYKTYNIVYENGDYYDGHNLAMNMLEKKAPHQLCGHLIRRSLYVDNGIKAVEGLNWSEDFQVMPRLAYYANRVSTLHEALYFYDRTTEDSYSNNYNISSFQQSWEVSKIIDSFFSDKESIFVKSCNVAKINKIAEYMRIASQPPFDTNSYDFLIKELDLIDKSYWKYVPIHNRIVLYLKKRRLVSYYHKSLSLFK